jgi:hypothetical protein
MTCHLRLRPHGGEHLKILRGVRVENEPAGLEARDEAVGGVTHT